MVFLGGGIGSVLRYSVSMLCKNALQSHSSANDVFPWATLIVNIVGCFIIGILFMYSESLQLTKEIKLLLIAGFCGGFTTFSAFSIESVTLIQNGHYFICISYILASIILGMAAAALPTIIHNC